MKNRFVSGCLALFLLFSSSTTAVVVDELLMIKEADNLTGKIEVRDLIGIDQRKLSVRIAEPSLYRQMGLPYGSFLKELELTFIAVNEGEGVINIAFPYGAVEDFDLLIQLEWPQGRLVHRYLVRLQHSLFATEERIVVRISPTNVLTNIDDEIRQERLIAAINERMRSVQVETVDGDNWHNVAQAIHQAYIRDAAVNIEQVMLALRDANPDDFIGWQPSILRIGASLQLPDYYDITVRSSSEAKRALAAILSKPSTQPRLKLAVAEIGKSATATHSADFAALEELDKAKRERADIRNELALVDTQLEQIERLIDLKYEEIALIQAAAAEQETAEKIGLIDETQSPQLYYDLESALRQRWEALRHQVQTRPWFWSAAAVLILLFLVLCTYLFVLLNGKYRRSGQDRASLMRELRRSAIRNTDKQTRLFSTEPSQSQSVKTPVLRAEQRKADIASPPADREARRQYIEKTPAKQEELDVAKQELLQDNPKTADLDLALAYINMSELDRAKSLLEGVLKDGTEEEKQKAQELLKQITT